MDYCKRFDVRPSVRFISNSKALHQSELLIGGSIGRGVGKREGDVHYKEERRGNKKK